MDEPMGLLITAGGIFAIVCAVGDWDWFMNHRKARAMVRLLGRNGTRIFYGALGTLLLVLGVLLTFGILKSSQGQ